MKEFLSMKKWALVLMSLLMIVTVAFTACDDEEDDDKPAATAGQIEDGGELKGSITENVTVVADAAITLKGVVKVKKGATLTIKEGVTVKADTASLSYLIIEQGAKIEAVGTAEKPIVFTSGKEAGQRSPKDWGGIAINGYAKINTGSETAEGEGDSGTYGGTDDADNSGTLKYVRIEFAGYKFSEDVELNGLALQGVGSGTTIDYVQTHSGADDGIEMFGGNVNLSHVISSGNGDDQLDCTEGWRGTVSYAIAVVLPGGDKGIEHDNNGKANEATPVATASYNNLTLVAAAEEKGAHIREGMNASFTDSYFAYQGDVTSADESSDKLVILEHKLSKVTVKDCVFQNVAADKDGIKVETKYDHDDDDTTEKIEYEADELPADPVISGNSVVASGLDLANFATADALAAKGADAFVTSSKGAVTSSSDNWAAGWSSFPAK